MIETDYLLWRGREWLGTAARLGGRFRRDAKGATAVEFGMVLVPFAGLIMAMMETALVFMSGQVLDNAVQNGARLVLTGQATTGSDASKMQFDKTTFKNKVCESVTALFNCKALVTIDVQKLAAFGSSPNFSPTDANGKYDTSKWDFKPGCKNDVMIVRAAMAYPIWISYYSTAPLANLGGGKRLVMASTVFKTEPHENCAGGGGV